MQRENELSNIVIGCAIKIHKALGPGLLESAYQACLHYELTQNGLSVECSYAAIDGKPSGDQLEPVFYYFRKNDIVSIKMRYEY